VTTDPTDLTIPPFERVSPIDFNDSEPLRKLRGVPVEADDEDW
jgi:hypothetical protein